MEISRYHRFLRVLLVVFTVALLFDSGIVFPVTKTLSDNTVLYLASTGTGVFANVPESEINALSAKLAEQQSELDRREADLREREIAARSFGAGSGNDYSTYIISAILFIILVLLVLNYAMDFARVRKYTYENQAL